MDGFYLTIFFSCFENLNIHFPYRPVANKKNAASITSLPKKHQRLTSLNIFFLPYVCLKRNNTLTSLEREREQTKGTELERGQKLGGKELNSLKRFFFCPDSNCTCQIDCMKRNFEFYFFMLNENSYNNN